MNTHETIEMPEYKNIGNKTGKLIIHWTKKKSVNVIGFI